MVGKRMTWRLFGTMFLFSDVIFFSRDIHCHYFKRKRHREKTIILAFTALAGPPDYPRPTLAYSMILRFLYNLMIP